MDKEKVVTIIPDKQVVIDKSDLDFIHKQYKDKIADLESKLAESEKLKDDAMYNLALLNQDLSDTKEKLSTERRAYNILHGNYSTLISSYDQLKQQLAESEKFMQANRFKTWKEAQESLNGKFECIFDEKHELWKKIVAENAQLKKQLAEKDKIEYTEAIRFVETSEPHIVAEELERLECEILDLEQSQNQTAIEELEKFKKLMHKTDKHGYIICFLSMNDREKFNNLIDQQIAELKGEK